MPSGPTVWGFMKNEQRKPTIQVRPQIPRMRNAMRTTGQRWTMRSMIGISIAESPMKIRRIVSTGRWYPNPLAPFGMAGRRAMARPMFA